MLVTKILEGTLSAGQTTITFTDSAIPNSFIRVGSTNPDLFPTEQTISGSTLTIKYEAQSSALGVVVELVKAGMTINDTLTSTATDEALSANQGKALKDIIDGMGVPSIEDLTDVNITDPATDDILIYDGTEEEWVNTSMPNIPADIDDLQDVVITSPSDDDVLTYDNGEWVNKPAQGGGSSLVVYDFEWVATASTTTKTALTETKNLPAGKYIAIVHTPYGTNVVGYQFMILDDNEYVYQTSVLGNSSYNSISMFFDLDSASDIKLASATNTSVTWDSQYISEGGMRIIKVGDI